MQDGVQTESKFEDIMNKLSENEMIYLTDILSDPTTLGEFTKY